MVLPLLRPRVHQAYSAPLPELRATTATLLRGSLCAVRATTYDKEINWTIITQLEQSIMVISISGKEK
jgi:hypothetical protein